MFIGLHCRQSYDESALACCKYREWRHVRTSRLDTTLTYSMSFAHSLIQISFFPEHVYLLFSIQFVLSRKSSSRSKCQRSLAKITRISAHAKLIRGLDFFVLFSVFKRHIWPIWDIKSRTRTMQEEMCTYFWLNNSLLDTKRLEYAPVIRPKLH